MYIRLQNALRGASRVPVRIQPHPIRVRVQLRTQASVATPGPAVTATNRAEASLKRFWKTVGLEKQDDMFVVMLDKRPLKTPSGNRLLIPKDRPLAAALVAAEWENQETLLKQHSLPMTSLVSRAIDAFGDDNTKKEVRERLIKYLETDTICFHSSEPAILVDLQKAHWEPLLEWAQSTVGVEIRAATDSFVLDAHPPELFTKFDELLSSFDQWQMAVMERATYASKSFLIGLALTLRRVSVEEAAKAAHVEVNSQIEKWGEVEDSHDVDYYDIRRQLGSAACLISKQ